MFFERSSWQGIDLISSTAKDVSTDKVGCKVHAPQLKSYAQMVQTKKQHFSGMMTDVYPICPRWLYQPLPRRWRWRLMPAEMKDRKTFGLATWPSRKRRSFWHFMGMRTLGKTSWMLVFELNSTTCWLIKFCLVLSSFFARDFDHFWPEFISGGLRIGDLVKACENLKCLAWTGEVLLFRF